MQISKSPNFKRKENTPVVIAIGAFDGLHLGHQKIINRTKKIAKVQNLPCGIFTFSPHPLRVISDMKAPGHLLSTRQKLKKIKKMNLDYYFKQKFTREFSNINFENFIKNILIDKINIDSVVVGEDFKFGNEARGDKETLMELSEKYDFGIEILPHLKINNQVVSSSFIRSLVKKGEVGQIPDFLGDYYEIEGKVIKGEGRGKELGFPTANLELPVDYVLPEPGVYAGYVYYQNQSYKAIGNFGFKPTFSGKKYQIEIHILDLSREIYGENISFEMVKFIREEKKYENIEKLKEQIKRDILYTDNVLW